MSGLFLNFFEIGLNKREIELNYLQYKDYATKEQWLKLIHSDKELFYYRPRESERIIYWSLTRQKESNGNNHPKERVELDKAPYIFTKTIELGIVSLFRSNAGLIVFKSKHDAVWSLKSRTDVLNATISGLQVNRIVEISMTTFNVNGNVVIGFLLSTRLSNNFTWSPDDFKKNGIDFSGLSTKNGRVSCDKASLLRFLKAKGKDDLYNQIISVENSNAKSFEIITKTAEYLNKHKQEVFLPCGLQIITIQKAYIPLFKESVNSEFLQKAQRRFYSSTPNAANLRKYNDLVRVNKPFSFEAFSTRVIKIGILCPKQYEGTIEPVFKRLRDLLKNDFHIKDIAYVTILTDDTSIQSYTNKLYEQSLLSSDLNIIIVQNSDLDLPYNQSPYYVCKAKYMGHGIPTQDIKIEKIKNCNDYILNNLSLNIYAKIGGTAWAIEKEEKLKDEVVVGIGSTIGHDGKSVLGIAQVFHSNGTFIVGDCAPLSDFTCYKSNLTEYLTSTLRDVCENYIDTSKEFRLIFHLYKSASARYEIAAITAMLNKFKSFNFKFALVHVGYGHNFRLFYNDGKNEVMKGTLLRLNPHTSLLHFVPNSTIPLKIAIDQRSTFTDAYYISKQIYWFSELSHKSYNPAKRTVTIMYPSLMANMVEKLKNVNGWDYERLRHVKDKLWFI